MSIDKRFLQNEIKLIEIRTLHLLPPIIPPSPKYPNSFWKYPTSQINCLSSKWIFMCIFKQDLLAKYFRQTEHWLSCRFTFECVSTWDKQSDFVIKRFPQMLHSYGFKPKWRFSWLTRPCFALKLRLHMEHLNDLLELCVFKWMVR